jgi:hypothetical protein
MPFTPFHFGPATLVKALLPRSFSLTAFVGSQVAIDLESGYHLYRHEWPVHRFVHTLPVATVVGLLSGTIVWLAGRWVRPSDKPHIQSEVQLLPAHVGGFVGGPDANSFLDIIGLDTLHVLCFATGLIGLGILTRSFAAP